MQAPAFQLMASATACMVIASRRKAGQNAFQAVGIATEQQEAKKKIVAAYMKAKLCWTSLWLGNWTLKWTVLGRMRDAQQPCHEWSPF